MQALQRLRAANVRTKMSPAACLQGEALELRELLSASPASIDESPAITDVLPDAASLVATQAEPAAKVPVASSLSIADGDAIVLVRGGVEVQAFSSAEESDTERGDTLRAVLRKRSRATRFCWGRTYSTWAGWSTSSFPPKLR